MNFQPVPDRQEIERAIGLGGGARARRTLARLAWLVVAALLVGGGIVLYFAALGLMGLRPSQFARRAAE